MQATWSHLFLFIKLCDVRPSNDLTAEWVALLEEHHAHSLPFTLWPLTYRTSVVTASSAVESPHEFRASDDVNVRFYRSNDVLVVCTSCPDELLSKYSPHAQEDYCHRMAIVNTTFGTTTFRSHKSIHRYDPREILVPCDFFQTYCEARTVIMRELIKQLEESDREGALTSVVCTGFRAGAIQAVYLAYDLAREFEEQRRFYAEPSVDGSHPDVFADVSPDPVIPKTVRVDCFTFGEPRTGNRAFWDSFDSIVASHTRVAHTRDSIVHSNFHDCTVSSQDVIYVDDSGPIPRTSCASFWHMTSELFQRIFVRIIPKSRFDNVDVSTYGRSIEKAVRIDRIP